MYERTKVSSFRCEYVGVHSFGVLHKVGLPEMVVWLGTSSFLDWIMGHVWEKEPQHFC